MPKSQIRGQEPRAPGRGAACVIACLTVLATSLGLGLPGPARAADPAPTVVVEYRPPLLTVEARGAPLALVLHEIGSRVGFTVVDDGKGRKITADLSIRSASVDEALRRLLRDVNHVVIYSAGAGVSSDPGAVGIAQIVLLGPSDSRLTSAELEAGQTGSRDKITAESRRDIVAPISSRGLQPAEPLLDSSVASESAQWSLAPGSDLDPVSVERLLANAAAAALPADMGGVGGKGSSNLAAAPENLEAALAETTRRAQQNLATLVEALAAATESLRRSSGQGGQ